MIRTRLLIALFAALFIVMPGLHSHAQQQTGADPSLAFIDGDLYIWDGVNVLPITDSGYAFDPAVSPDGTQLAYVEYADITLDFLATVDGVGGGALPTDIRIYFYENDVYFPLTQQPPGASMTNVMRDSIARGAPVWSPEGDAIAWTEVIYTQSVLSGTAYFLIVYDANDNRIRRVSALPLQAGVPVPPRVEWGETGLVVWSVTLNASDEFVDSLLVFTRDGTQTATIPVPPRNGSDFISDFLLVDYQGEEFIAVIFGSGEVVLYTPMEIGSTVAPGVLQAYSLLRPGGVGLSIYPEGGFGSPYVAEIDDGTGVTLPVGYELTNVAVAPDADRYAYAVENGVVVTDGQRGETFIPAPGDGFVSQLVWAPQGWRIDPTFTPPSSEAAAQLAGCNLTPRLAIGDEGYVLPGPANRLRTQPDTDSTIIDNIPGEAFFTVIGGPVCNQGFLWWEVQFGDVFGWTAAGADGEYYVAPAPAG